jgi:hypothetical protein
MSGLILRTVVSQDNAASLPRYAMGVGMPAELPEFLLP